MNVTVAKMMQCRETSDRDDARRHYDNFPIRARPPEAFSRPPITRIDDRIIVSERQIYTKCCENFMQPYRVHERKGWQKLYKFVIIDSLVGSFISR